MLRDGLHRIGERAAASFSEHYFEIAQVDEMQSWIDQAKTKLLGIIDQAKKDVTNFSLYRDFGDRVQFESFDFHKEYDLHKLAKKVKKIKAYGAPHCPGQDFPEDVAGGLKLATELDWRGNIGLCILLADASCHGNVYHTGIGDMFPNGYPMGNDQAKLLYKLQYKIGADFYFIRIAQHTDKMIRVQQNRAGVMFDRDARARRLAGGKAATKRDIVVHDLGSEDNRFLYVVVESVKVSVQQYLFESY